MAKGRFEYKTVIKKDRRLVWDFFSDPANLQKITSFPRVQVIRDSEQEERIKIKLNFFLFRITWYAVITEKRDQDYFIDEGDNLPFPLRHWKHTHQFESSGTGTIMTDKVEYRAFAPDFLVKMMLILMFKSREKKIRSIFRWI
ncbi:hypothetical protein MM300_18815 [Evansella sp. LMS18]|uniref:SRPBCC family protein n=1 Tax=Evansella sp. LMS18 TaxID=2924033 RepID=UPI0020D17BB4|nr:SRPBCC family protein [Evansella sp. LMS18]UTR09914.1 hypothetical protein MM300_18815 [Evansella sp. LMS18]